MPKQRTFDFDPISLTDATELGGVFEIQDSEGKSLYIGSAGDVRLALLRIFGDEDGFAAIHGAGPNQVVVFWPYSQDDRAALARALIRANRPVCN